MSRDLAQGQCGGRLRGTQMLDDVICAVWEVALGAPVWVAFTNAALPLRLSRSLLTPERSLREGRVEVP